MRRLLVIDDHDDIRENIAEILGLAGYEVFTAQNGNRGVETALKEKPELVICDIMMLRAGRLRRPASFAEKREATVNTPVHLSFSPPGRSAPTSAKGWRWARTTISLKPFDDIELLERHRDPA